MQSDAKKIWNLMESKNPLGVLYHFTDMILALDIIKENRFKLTFGYNDSDISSSGKSFYLSTSRSPLGEYASPHRDNFALYFVLDAGKLSQSYEIKPVDYWAGVTHKVKDEMEDRIYSNKATIPARPYIKEIRIYVPNIPEDKKDDRYFNKLRIIRSLHDEEIPVRVWNDLNKFLSGRGDVTDKYINLRSGFKDFDIILNWLSQAKPEYDWKKAYSDTWSSFRVDIHNMRRNPTEPAISRLNKLQQLIRKNGVKTLDELIKKKLKESQEGYQ